MRAMRLSLCLVLGLLAACSGSSRKPQEPSEPVPVPSLTLWKKPPAVPQLREGTVLYSQENPRALCLTEESVDVFHAYVLELQQYADMAYAICGEEEKK